ncbi:unnamed protein product, partial [marine sediment metagenome]
MEPDRAFHRSYCLLHSRTVEYPYAIRHAPGIGHVLDVGISGADPNWVKQLAYVYNQATAIDIRCPGQDLFGIKFLLGDIRNSR